MIVSDTKKVSQSSDDQKESADVNKKLNDLGELDKYRDNYSGSRENDSSIVEEVKRKVEDHPLLQRIYSRHDEIISHHTGTPCLDIGFGKKPFNGATHGVEPEENNYRFVKEKYPEIEIRQDSGLDIGFEIEFDSIVAKRLIHHLPPSRRDQFLQHIKEKLEDDGKFVVMEGTPGNYRRFVKGLAFRLGILGEDVDEYGHLSTGEVEDLLERNGFEIVEKKFLGSPLMPLSYFNFSNEFLFKIYKSTQFVKWWTLFVAKKK